MRVWSVAVAAFCITATSASTIPQNVLNSQPAELGCDGIVIPSYDPKELATVDATVDDSRRQQLQAVQETHGVSYIKRTLFGGHAPGHDKAWWQNEARTTHNKMDQCRQKAERYQTSSNLEHNNIAGRYVIAGNEYRTMGMKISEMLKGEITKAKEAEIEKLKEEAEKDFLDANTAANAAVRSVPANLRGKHVH